MSARTHSRRATACPCLPGADTARCRYGCFAEARLSASSAPQKHSRAPSAAAALLAQRRKPSRVVVRSAPLCATERACRCTLRAPPSLYAPNFAKVVTDAYACRPKWRLARIRRKNAERERGERMQSAFDARGKPFERLVAMLAKVEPRAGIACATGPWDRAAQRCRHREADDQQARFQSVDANAVM